MHGSRSKYGRTKLRSDCNSVNDMKQRAVRAKRRKSLPSTEYVGRFQSVSSLKALPGTGFCRIDFVAVGVASPLNSSFRGAARFHSWTSVSCNNSILSQGQQRRRRFGGPILLVSVAAMGSVELVDIGVAGLSKPSRGARRGPSEESAGRGRARHGAGAGVGTIASTDTAASSPATRFRPWAKNPGRIGSRGAAQAQIRPTQRSEGDGVESTDSWKSPWARGRRTRYRATRPALK